MIVKNVDEIKETQAHGEAFYRYFFMRRDIYGYLGMEDILRELGGFWQTVVNSGKKMDPHSHENHEQIYYVLDGGGLLTVGEETRRVGRGDAVYIPPKISHSFQNDTDKPCLILMVDAIVEK